MYRLPIRAELLVTDDDEVTMPVGTTTPPLRVRARDGDGEIIKLNDVRRVTFSLGNNGERIVDGQAARVVHPDDGVIQYEWRDQDTRDPGFFTGQFMIDFGNDTLACPSDGSLYVALREGV